MAAGQRGAGRPRGSEFVFARLRYESGDWDYNPKVAATTPSSSTRRFPFKEEVVISASSAELPPFRSFHDWSLSCASAVRNGRTAEVADAGGLPSGRLQPRCERSHARSFEQEMVVAFRTVASRSCPTHIRFIAVSSVQRLPRRRTSSTGGATTSSTRSEGCGAPRPAGRSLQQQGLRVRMDPDREQAVSATIRNSSTSSYAIRKPHLLMTQIMILLSSKYRSKCGFQT
jgi:hypothetical protein